MLGTVDVGVDMLTEPLQLVASYYSLIFICSLAPIVYVTDIFDSIYSSLILVDVNSLLELEIFIPLHTPLTVNC